MAIPAGSHPSTFRNFRAISLMRDYPQLRIGLEMNEVRYDG
jgi:hypothetical protein